MKNISFCYFHTIPQSVRLYLKVHFSHYLTFKQYGDSYGIFKGCIFAILWKSLHLPYPFFTFWQLLPNPSISRCFLYSNPGNNHCFRCKLLNRLSRKKTQNPLTTGYINNWKISWIIFAKTLTVIYVFGIILVWR